MTSICKNIAAFISSLVIGSAALAATYYGPTSLTTSTTISSTSWKSVLSQAVDVTNSVKSCTTDPIFSITICYYDNMPSVIARVKDAGAVTAMKYRFLVDGTALTTPTVTDNGDGSVTITATGAGIANGNRVFKLQIAKKSSGSPTNTISPASGDSVHLGVTMSKP